MKVLFKGVFFSFVFANGLFGQTADVFAGLEGVAGLFSGRFAAIIGTIALVVGVVSYLVSTSTDLSPILRLLVKIVMCLSLMVGGASMLSSIVQGLGTSSSVGTPTSGHTIPGP